jgi:single-strand DNA-binding protein
MYQKTLIVGRVGGDAEMRYTPSGDPVTSFSVAVSRKFRNGGGEQQERKLIEQECLTAGLRQLMDEAL